VTIQNVTPEIGESLGISAKSGALINDVVAGGPAAKGGVMAGDVVMNVNGKGVTSASDLTRQVALVHAGQAIKLEVLRGGKHVNLTVISGMRPSESALGNGPTDDENQTDKPARPQLDRTNVLGMGLVILDDAARRRLGVKPEVMGVAVDQVGPNSIAGKAGLRRGDVVMRVGDMVVSKPAEVQAAADAAKKASRPLLMLINRNGRPQFLALKTVEDAPKAP
jgi:serine protease Do